MNKRKGHVMLLIVTIVFLLATISSLVPQASASKPCLLGYYAHCSFTPISTIICLVLAGFTFFIWKKKNTEERAG